MRYAIFSDIHGNRPAWEAVVADMERMQVQVLVCLGDVVGYGPCPQEVLSDVRSRTKGFVLGNHEAAAAGMMDVSALNPFARQTTEWTREQLDEESLQFIRKLPLKITHGSVLFVHAESAKPGRFGYINDIQSAQESFAATDYQLTFVGHTHVSTVFRLDENGVVEQLPDEDCILSNARRYIVNVGSVGEPRTADDLRARYVVYDELAQELYFRRVEFDIEACRADLAKSGLEITPWYLTVSDHPRTPEATPALAQDLATPVASGSGAGVGEPQELVLPAGAQANAQAVPMARPIPRRRRRSRAAVALVLVSVLAVLAVLGGLVALQIYYAPDDSTADTTPPVKPAAGPQAPSANSPADPVPGPEDPSPEVTPPAPAEPQEPEPPVVAIVPEPAGEPEPAPAPEPAAPDPKPTPKRSSPSRALPIPPEPANAATIRLAEGLMFYAPLDEDGTELTASDKSSGGRDLDITSALPGSLGQVGMACQLEEGGAGIASQAKPLPALPAITISIWIRRPSPPVPEPPLDEEPAAADGQMELEEGEKAREPAERSPPPSSPPFNLIAIKDYLEVRLEDGDVVANLDRQGAEARLALPYDKRWHHILVANGEGSTTIWIDHASHSEPVAETLTPPAGNAAVLIGGGAADFYVDEVAIWNRRFTPEERQMLYRNGRLGEPILTPTRAVAYWAFDEKISARLFGDLIGEHALGAFKSWKSVRGIAPNPIPFTRKLNPHAAQIWHIAERKEDAGSFQMKPNLPFTYEGWVRLGSNSTGTLGGTISGTNEEKMPGWRLAPGKDKAGKGMLAFIYESGATKVQALGEELPIYNGLPHHFAAVWNPMGSPTHGTMDLYLDNEKVATASLLLSSLGSVSDQPFRIVARGNPFVLDEVRFTAGALKPDAFLTAGLAGPAAEVAVKEPPKGETILQRRDREMRERKAKKGK